MTFSNTPAPSDVASFEVVLKLAFTRNGHAVQMRRVRLANPTIDSLKATVQRWARGSFTLQYTDSEGDTVTMDAEEEWAECLALWRAAGDATAPLAVQVEQATGKRAASPSGVAAAADSSADDAVHGASSSDMGSEAESGSDECWLELLGKGGKKGPCAKGVKGVKGCKGMKGRKGKKAWLKRCLFARRCGGGGGCAGTVEDEKVAAAEDAAAEDRAAADGEACVEVHVAQLAANADGTSHAGTACEDEDFAWDFDPSGKLGMKGGKGVKGRKGAGKGLKRCFFARRCGWEVEDGLAAEPAVEGGSDSGAEHELAWDLDAAGKKGMKGGKGIKGRKGWRCLFARRCRGWKAEDETLAEDSADDCAMVDDECVEAVAVDDAAAADAFEDADFAWDLDVAGKKGMKGGKGMKGCKGRKGWVKRCLFARRWKAEDETVAEDSADDCAMVDEEDGIKAVHDACADAAACDGAGKLGMKGCKGMKGWKGRRILKAGAAAQSASEVQRVQVALVDDEQAAGPRAAAAAAAEPPAVCAGCGFVVTGVTPDHCCKRCSKNAGAHGPRCAQLTPEEAQVEGVPVSPAEWRGRKCWAARYAAASGQPAGCEDGGAAPPVAMCMKAGKKGRKGAKGCKGEKGARGERRSWLSAFSWWGGAADDVSLPTPSAPEAEPAEACRDAPSKDSPVKDVV